VEGGDDDDWLVSPASSRPLFFDTPVFELFAGDDFIVQVTRVFTRIRSEAAKEGALRRRASVDPMYLAVVATEEKGAVIQI
jgi:hypothetical protein